MTATRTLVERFYRDLWNRWDDDAVEEIVAEDFEFRGSLGTRTNGLAAWRDYRDSIRLGARDFHNEIVDLVVDGEHAAARLSYTGTHTGPLAGHAGTGRRFTYAGAAFFAAADGRLRRAWVLGDLAGLTAQLT